MSKTHTVPYLVVALVVVVALTLGAAAGGALAGGFAGYNLAAKSPTTAHNTSWSVSAPAPQPVSAVAQQTAEPPKPAVVNALTAQDLLLEQLYQRISPSVVNIAVTSNVVASSVMPNIPDLPDIPGLPAPFGRGQGQGQGQGQNFVQQAEGSGWVYSAEGYIVTNNHVVEGATRINVTFFDDRTVTAKLVAADPDSDLAVIKVDPAGLDLRPLTIGDSQGLKVGQQVIAIGNPFGLEGTMTVGIVSALGRSLPTGSATNTGARYTIPDVIQTDAAINPGNSGGPLLDTEGNVIGVTAAIESMVRANSGVGFVIPARILKVVIPVLAKGGKMEYPWIGISGTTLNPQLNAAMDLSAGQRGVLVVDVTKDSPADKAKLEGSSKTVDVDGQQLSVGGDILTGINDQQILKFDDLLTYLIYNTKPGDSVTLKVMRDGQAQNISLTLAGRPPQSARQTQSSGQ